MHPIHSLKLKVQRHLSVFVIFLLVFFLFVQFTPPIHKARAAGNTYYVDNLCSNNGNGTSQTCASSSGAAGPFNSLANMQAKSGGYQPDDQILLKTGETFRETLTPPSSGTYGNPVTFGAYGGGAQPIIDGLNVVASSSWTLQTQGGTNFTSGHNLDGWWRFSTSSSLGTDSSGNGNTLAVTGAVSQALGPNMAVPEAAVLVASSTQYFNIANASLSTGFPGKSTASSSVTLSVWIKPTTNDESGNLIMTAGPAYGLIITNTLSGNNNIQFGVIDSSSTGHTLSSTSTINTLAGAWSHIAATWNSSTGAMNLYINGVNANKSTVTSATEKSNSHPFQIGQTDSYYGGPDFDGAIAEPAVFATALTQAQIQSIYNYGMTGSQYNTYYTSLASNPQQVFEDGTRLVAVGSAGAMVPGTFWFNTASSSLYVRMREDNNPSGHTIEVGARTNAVNMTGGQQYITLSGLTLHGAMADGLRTYGNFSGLQINNCVLEWNYGAGWSDDDASTVTSITNVVASSSTFRYNGGSGIQVGVAQPNGWNIIGNQLYSNAQLIVDASGTPVNSSEEQYWDAGIKILSPSQTGGVGTVISNNLVYNNGVSGGSGSQGMGIWPDTISGVTVEYNLVYGNYGSGIFLEKNVSSTAAYNVLYNNTLWATVGSPPTDPHAQASLMVAAGAGWNSSGNLIANNTIYGGWWGISNGNESNASDTGQSNNNVFRNNIVMGATNYDLYAYQGGDNDGIQGSGNVYDHNAFGVAGPTLAWWETTGAISTYSTLNTAYGSNMSNVQSNPIFISSSTDNFAIASSSPTIDAGMNLGTNYDMGLDPASTWPSNIILDNQNSYGSGWDIGAYVYTQTSTPSIAMTTPAASSTVSGTISVTATSSAVAPASIASVQFYLDGSPLGSPITSTSSPNTYSSSWNTASSTNASHTLYALATDNYQNVATSSPITITVQNATGSPPIVSSFSASPTNVAPAGTSTLSWNVSGTVSSVAITPGSFSSSMALGSTTVNPTSGVPDLLYQLDC